jgi:hypothetical protein
VKQNLTYPTVIQNAQAGGDNQELMQGLTAFQISLVSIAVELDGFARAAELAKRFRIINADTTLRPR